jgi:hypothetical protein
MHGCSTVLQPSVHTFIPYIPPSVAPTAMQLSYLHRLFDVEGLLHSLGDREAASAAAEKLAPLRPALDEAAAAAAVLRDASAHRWVDLGAMFGRLAGGGTAFNTTAAAAGC